MQRSVTHVVDLLHVWRTTLLMISLTLLSSLPRCTGAESNQSWWPQTQDDNDLMTKISRPDTENWPRSLNKINTDDRAECERNFCVVDSHDQDNSICSDFESCQPSKATGVPLPEIDTQRETFALRRSSCVRPESDEDEREGDLDMRAFWHHAGLLAHGTINVRAVIPRTRRASICAAICSKDAECSSFAFSFIERQCILLRAAQLTLCDPAADALCTDSSNALLDQISLFSGSRCRHAVFFFEDYDSYCSSDPSGSS